MCSGVSSVLSGFQCLARCPSWRKKQRSDLGTVQIILASGGIRALPRVVPPTHLIRQRRDPALRSDRMTSILRNVPLLAVLAHGIIGASLVWDKALLKNRGTKNLVSYVFWLGSLSLFGVALVPCRYKSAGAGVIWYRRLPECATGQSSFWR